MKKSSSIKNIFYSLLQQMIAIICGFIVPKLIIETYGSSTNGLLTSITNFLAYITLLEAGVGPVIKAQLYKPIAKKDKEEIENILYSSEKYFRKIAKIFLIYILLLTLLYPMIVNNSVSKIFSMSLILIISISSFAEYYFGMSYRLFLFADKKSYVVSIIQIITTVLNVIIIVVLALNNVNILVVKLLSSLVFVIRPIAQHLYVKKYYKFDFSNVKKNYQLKNKWDGLAQHIAAIIYTNTDVAVLTICTSVVQVSIYGVYNLITSSLQKIIQSISIALEATFGDMIARENKKRLRNSFHEYEILYYTMISIIYICTFSLIIPFVTLYTKGIKDANYVLPIFGFLMVMNSFLYSIKLPYHSLTKIAGHFKQVQLGAWFEAFINLFVSIILALKFGLTGVVIGTIVATLIRGIELIKYVSGKITNEKSIKSFTKIIICFFQVFIFSFIIFKILKNVYISNFLEFIMLALLILITSTSTIFIINLIIYKNLKFIIIDIIKKIIGDNKNEKKN